MHAIRSIAFHFILIPFVQAFFMAHKLFSIALMAMLVHSFAASTNSYIFSENEIFRFCPSSSFIARPGILIASLDSENFNFISLIKPWTGTKKRFIFAILKSHIRPVTHARTKSFPCKSTRTSRQNEKAINVLSIRFLRNLEIIFHFFVGRRFSSFRTRASIYHKAIDTRIYCLFFDFPIYYNFNSKVCVSFFDSVPLLPSTFST